MMREIFRNDKVAIIYDDETEEISIGFLGDAITPYEAVVLEGIFGTKFANRDEEEDE